VNVDCGDRVVHDAGVYDVDDGLTCRMADTLRELRSLVHLPDFSRGVPAEAIRHRGYVCEVARIESRLVAVGPLPAGKYIGITRAGENELVVLVVVLEGPAGVQHLARGEDVARSSLPDADFAEVTKSFPRRRCALPGYSRYSE
jgi:hypothetical protein